MHEKLTTMHKYVYTHIHTIKYIIYILQLTLSSFFEQVVL